MPGTQHEWQWWENEAESPRASDTYRDIETLRERIRALRQSGPDREHAGPGLTQTEEEAPQRETPWLESSTLEA